MTAHIHPATPETGPPVPTLTPDETTLFGEVFDYPDIAIKGLTAHDNSHFYLVTELKRLAKEMPHNDKIRQLLTIAARHNVEAAGRLLETY